MTQTRKQYSLEEKRQHVAAWRASGLTRLQYCELHNIRFSTFRVSMRGTRIDDQVLIVLTIFRCAGSCGQLCQAVGY